MAQRVPLGVAPLALAAVALTAALVAFAATGPSKGDAAVGTKIYDAKCTPCHKSDGTGGIKLSGNPTPNWKDAKHVFDPKFNDDVLRDCLTNGKPKSGMPAWGKTGQLKPDDIENLIAYIHQFFPKKK